MALYYQRQNNPEEALKIYDRLITDNGFDQQLAIDRGWLILFQGNPEKITHFYRQHQHHNAIPEWQPLLAASAEMVGEDRAAIALYLSLLGREPQNYAYSLSLAALLERQQLGEASARLHRYLSADLERIPDSEFIRKTTLVGRFFGPLAQSQQYADRLVQKGSLTKEETSQFYTSLLAQDQAALAHFYFGRRVWLERELPDWQKLQRAMRIGDRNKIAQLLISSDRLPPADSMTALTQIDKPHDALYLAQRSVLNGLSDTSEQQVINNWSGLRPAGFRAIQLEFQPEDPLGAKSFGLTSFWSDNDWQWHARLSQLDFEDSGRQSFQSLNLGAGKAIDRGRLSWQIHGDFGRQPSRYGAAVRLDRQLDSHWQVNVEGALNEPALANSAWRQQGDKNRLQAGFSYSPNARNQLSADLALLDYNAPGGVMDTQGYRLNLRASERWLFRRPNASAYLAVTWDELKNQFRPAALDQSNQSLIFDPYRQISLGQRFWHGEVGQAPYTVASPHWYSDFSLGYQPDEQDWGINISAGLGWRIVGDDELALRLNYQSQSRQLKSFSGIRLSYYLHY